MPAALTPTSYAILGLLAIQPWTTYELTRQMDRAVGQFWPRAESRLYEEPKKLVAHGLAAAEREHVGQRPRTVYSITPEGRERLATWVAQPAQSPPELHVEAMIKVFFAEHGSGTTCPRRSSPSTRGRTNGSLSRPASQPTTSRGGAPSPSGFRGSCSPDGCSTSTCSPCAGGPNGRPRWWRPGPRT